MVSQKYAEIFNVVMLQIGTQMFNVKLTQHKLINSVFKDLMDA